MNWKMIFVTASLLLGGFLLISSSGGRASTADEGNTGAPGDVAEDDRTCQNCHNSAGIQVTLQLSIADTFGIPAAFYIPGNIYEVKVNVLAAVGTPAAYGFQLVAETNLDHLSTNSFSSHSENAQLVSTSNNRQYAEHKEPSDTSLFSVRWAAPPTGSGSVTFYACGNGVNLDSMNTGDGAAKSSLTLFEEGMSAVSEIIAEAISIYPNPARESVQLHLPATTAGPLQILVSDQNGHPVYREKAFAAGYPFTHMIGLAGLPPGLYIVQVKGVGGFWSGKFLKH
jgi:hypothetical protein